MSWGSDFAGALDAIRNSQQQRYNFNLGRDANSAFGSSVQDPGLFQGAQPGAMPMPGAMPGTSDAYAYGGPPGQNVPPQGAPPPRQTPFQRPQFGYGDGGQTSKFDQPLYTPVAATMSRYAQDGINSIGGIAQRWAQENGSDPQPVIAFLSRAVGAAPDQPLSMEQRMAVAKGISLFDFKRGAQPAAGLVPPRADAAAMSPAGPQGFAGVPGEPASAEGLMSPQMTGMPMSGQRVGPSTVAMTTPGFSGGSPPPPAGGGAVAAGSPLPAAAPADGGQPPQGGAPNPYAGQGGQAPPMQVAANGSGIDMNRIIAAVQRANPNARPEVVGAVVKQFLPILTGERAQGNSDRTFAAGRSDEMYNRGVTERNYATGREDVAYKRSLPVAAEANTYYVDPITGEVKYYGGSKPDAGTMTAIRNNESTIQGLENSVKIFDSVLEPQPGSRKALNEAAYSGPLAGVRGTVGSVFGGKAGIDTEVLSNRISQNAINSLKATFGAMPTEGERKVLLDLAGSINKAPEVRREIYARARDLAKQRLEFTKRQTEEMRSGRYYQPGQGSSGPTVIDGVKIERMQ